MYQNPFINPNLINRTLFTLPKISLTNILTNTQKTLNVINQATTTYNQVKPIISNCKTLFKAFNIIKEEPKQDTNNINKKEKIEEQIFYL